MSRPAGHRHPAGAGRGGRTAAAWAGLPPGPRVAAAALVAWMALAVSFAGGDVLSGGPGDARAAAGAASAGPTVPAPALEAIAQRPLFSATRRPDAPPPAMAQAAPPPPPPRDRRITLKGVYLDGAQAKAFVVSAEQPEGAWVSAGGRVGPWRVAAVSAERVRFEAEGESFSAAMDPEAGHP